jgi:prevent-host-death family protein
MFTTSLSEARGNFARLIDQARTEPVVLERRGRREAVVIAPDYFDQLLQAAEELADIAAYDAALNEVGDNIAWEQARADLGWV